MTNNGNHPADDEAQRETVLDEVAREMERTAEHNSEATLNDYLADVVRHLNNLLPNGQRFFEGDYERQP